MFQEDYEEYLQDPKNFSHLAAVPDLLMEAMEEVRVGMHQMKEELAMMKSEIDEKSKTRKKNYISCASFFFISMHCMECNEVGVVMYVSYDGTSMYSMVCVTLTCYLVVM